MIGAVALALVANGCLSPRHAVSWSDPCGPFERRPSYFSGCNDFAVDGRHENGDTMLAIVFAVPVAIVVIGEVIRWICGGE